MKLPLVTRRRHLDYLQRSTEHAAKWKRERNEARLRVAVLEDAIREHRDRVRDSLDTRDERLYAHLPDHQETT